jgi:rod shape-determining protein MreD
MVLLSCIMDTAILPNVTILGVAADMTLCMAVSCSLLDGSFVGAMTGMSAGLLTDIAVGSMTGFYGIQYLIVGYLAGRLPKKIRNNGIFTPPLALAAAYLIRMGLLCVLLLIRGMGADVFAVLGVYLPLGMLLSVILMIPVHFLNTKLHNRRFMKTRYISEKEFDF